MPHRKNFALFSFFFLFAIVSQAQDMVTTANKNADPLVSQGKIYVVMAVVTTILTGLLFFLWRLDKKITRLEKDQNNM